MTRLPLTQALGWRPDALFGLAEGWDRGARGLYTRMEAAAAGFPDAWRGAAADAARERLLAWTARGEAVAMALVLAAAAARDGAGQLTIAQKHLRSVVDIARGSGFLVADDGVVSPSAAPSALLILLSGSNIDVAARMLEARAAELSRQVTSALDQLGAADRDAAQDIEAAFDTARGGHLDTPALPSVAGDRAWSDRIARNQLDVARAILEETPEHPAGRARIAVYEALLGEVDDPAGTGRRIDRQILAFDPDNGVLVELTGDLSRASSVVVLVPGMNTTIEGSQANAHTARQFVEATRGEVAAITYLGGPFPGDERLPSALVEAADPAYALDMAPRLVQFSYDVDRVVDGTGRFIPVTYVGHSYGGSILGTAEAGGLTADRTVYVAAAGAGVGVDDPGDWHNRNPEVDRFSMTAPGDPIQLVQGLPGGPHGADPDHMPGVVRLATGRHDDGRLVAGPAAHTDVVNDMATDSWRNLLAVITGDRAAIRVAQ